VDGRIGALGDINDIAELASAHAEVLMQMHATQAGQNP